MRETVGKDLQNEQEGGVRAPPGAPSDSKRSAIHVAVRSITQDSTKTSTRHLGTGPSDEDEEPLPWWQLRQSPALLKAYHEDSREPLPWWEVKGDAEAWANRKWNRENQSEEDQIYVGPLTYKGLFQGIGTSEFPIRVATDTLADESVLSRRVARLLQAAGRVEIEPYEARPEERLYGAGGDELAVDGKVTLTLLSLTRADGTQPEIIPRKIKFTVAETPGCELILGRNEAGNIGLLADDQREFDRIKGGGREFPPGGDWDPDAISTPEVIHIAIGNKSGSKIRFVRAVKRKGISEMSVRKVVWEAFQKAHNAFTGKRGVKETRRRLLEDFGVEATGREIRECRDYCIHCQKTRDWDGLSWPYPSNKRSIIGSSWQCDHLMVPESMQKESDIPYTAVFVMQEMVSRYTIFQPAYTQTAEETARLMMNVFGHFGIPDDLEILSDNGPGFKSEILDHLTMMMGGRRVKGTPHSHEDQGQVERVNGEFWKAMRDLWYDFPTRFQNWYTLLPSVQLIVNSFPYGDGVAPADLIMPALETRKTLFGLDRKPIETGKLNEFVAELVSATDELVEKVESRIRGAIEKARKDGEAVTKPVLRPGEFVLVREPREDKDKTHYKWKGPRVVVKQEGPKVWVRSHVDDSVKEVDIHRIRECLIDLSKTDPRAEELKDTYEVEVQEVIEMTGDKNQRSSLQVKVLFVNGIEQWLPWSEARGLEKINDFIGKSSENYSEWNAVLDQTDRQKVREKMVREGLIPARAGGPVCKEISVQTEEAPLGRRRAAVAKASAKASAPEPAPARVSARQQEQAERRGGERRRFIARIVRESWTTNAIAGDIFRWRAVEPDLADDVDGTRLAAVDMDMLRGETSSWTKAKIAETLTAEQREAVISVLKEYEDVATYRGVAKVEPLKNELIDPGAKPLFVPYRKMDRMAEDAMQSMIDELRSMGILEESTSKWNSPVMMVNEGKREDGTVKWRFVLDQKQGNKRVAKMPVDMPRMDDLLMATRGMSHMGKIDLTKFFFQIPLDEESKQLTAFTDSKGRRWQFTRLTMGGTNSPAYAQKLVTEIFGRNKAWIDDIHVGGTTFEEALDDLRSVLRKCREVGFQVSYEKLHFGFKEMDFLGRLIDGEGVRLNAETVTAVNEWQLPADKQKLQSFLGLCNYCNKFVEHYSTKARPLHDVVKGLATARSKIEWTEEAKQAFDSLKREINRPEKLHHPKQGSRFYVNTDASDIGWGAILYQLEIDEKGEERKILIDLLSGSFNPTQRRWPTVDQESFAIYKSVTAWRQYLLGQEFTLYTDHRNLTFMVVSEDKKIIRWKLALQEYDFEAIHIPGVLNFEADVLSRLSESTR